MHIHKYMTVNIVRDIENQIQTELNTVRITHTNTWAFIKKSTQICSNFSSIFIHFSNSALQKHNKVYSLHECESIHRTQFLWRFLHNITVVYLFYSLWYEGLVPAISISMQYTYLVRLMLCKKMDLRLFFFPLFDAEFQPLPMHKSSPKTTSTALLRLVKKTVWRKFVMLVYIYRASLYVPSNTVVSWFLVSHA